MATYVGLIACKDRPGLVHEITGVLFRQEVNVTENQEFVDHGGGRFFMRTQFDGQVDSVALASELAAKLPEVTLCEVREQKPRRLVVLASKEPHCLGDHRVFMARGQAGDVHSFLRADAWTSDGPLLRQREAIS